MKNLLEQMWLFFKKDCRHLYPEIGIVFLLTAGFTWVAPLEWAPQARQENGFLSYLLPGAQILLLLAWVVLISRAIHEETPASEKQFWITQPYRWEALLAEKFIFAGTFTSVPLFTAQCYLLHHAGLRLRPALPDLLLTEFLLFVVLVLPVMTLAASTSSLPALVLSLLAASIYLLITFGIASWILESKMPTPYAIPSTLLSAILLITSVLVLQYKGRLVKLAFRMLAALPIVFLAITIFASASNLINEAYPAQNLYETDAFHINPDPNLQQQLAGSLFLDNNTALLTLPVQLSEVNPGYIFNVQGVSLSFVSSGQTLWSSGYRNESTIFSNTWRDADLTIRIPAWTVERIGSDSVSLRLSVAGVLYRTAADNVRVDSQTGELSTPGNGICSLQGDLTTAACLYAFRKPLAMSISTKVATVPCTMSSSNQPLSLFVHAGDFENSFIPRLDPIIVSSLSISSQERQAGQISFLCSNQNVSVISHSYFKRFRMDLSKDKFKILPYLHRIATR